MKIEFSRKLATVAAAALLLFAPAPRAQEEEDVGIGRIYAEVGVWVSQASGVEFRPATVMDPGDPFNFQVLSLSHGTESRMRYRGGYELSRNVGGLIFTWFTHEEISRLSDSRPGNYIFGELLAHPYLAGFENDGLADGFSAEGRTNLRDFRLDFYRTAFSSARVTGRWYVGYRRVKHKREQSAEYLAVLNTLPPLIPPVSEPRPELDPLPDLAELRSSYRGRGIEAGMEVVMPLWKNKFMLEAGFGLAVLRGKVDASYRSTNAFYENSAGIVEPPYDPIWMDPVAVAAVDQAVDVRGLTAQSESLSGHVLEAHLGLRYKAWRELDVFVGFRSTQYESVGLDLREKLVTALSGFNTVDLEEVKRSVTYEGVYGGIAYSF